MNVFDYLIPIAIGAVFLVLCLGLWNMMRGGPGNVSQQFMRWRVILQFTALAVILIALYFSQR